MKHDLYLVHTPLHLLYSYNLVKHNGCPAIIFVPFDFADAPQVAARLNQVAKENQTYVPLIGEYPAYFLVRYPGVGKFAAKAQIIRNSFREVQQARRVYRHLAVGRLYVFNDTRNETQTIMHDLRRQGVDQIVYVDDGLSSYLPPINAPIRFHRYLLKYVFSQALQPSNNHGQYSEIDTALLLHPDAANSNFDRLTVERMPAFILQASDKEGLAYAFGFSSKAMTQYSAAESYVLVLPPHSSVVSDIQRLQEWLQTIAADFTGAGLIIKYHPREVLADYLNAISIPNVTIFDRAVPAELVPVVVGNVQALYTGISSVLITMDWVKSGVQVNFVNWMPVDLPLELKSLLEALDVRCVNI